MVPRVSWLKLSIFISQTAGPQLHTSDLAQRIESIMHPVFREMTLSWMRKICGEPSEGLLTASLEPR